MLLESNYFLLSIYIITKIFQFVKFFVELNSNLTKINGAASVYSGDGIAAYSKARYTLTVTAPTATNTRPVGIREIVSSDGDFIFTPVNISLDGRTITVDGFNCSGSVAYPGTISCNFSYREF